MFGDLGEPDAYIKGDEGLKAFIVGHGHGSGYLIRKGRSPRKSIGKARRSAFTSLGGRPGQHPDLHPARDQQRLFQRYPGVEGSIYFNPWPA